MTTRIFTILFVIFTITFTGYSCSHIATQEYQDDEQVAREMEITAQAMEQATREALQRDREHERIAEKIREELNRALAKKDKEIADLKKRVKILEAIVTQTIELPEDTIRGITGVEVLPHPTLEKKPKKKGEFKPSEPPPEITGKRNFKPADPPELPSREKIIIFDE